MSILLLHLAAAVAGILALYKDWWKHQESEERCNCSNSSQVVNESDGIKMFTDYICPEMRFSSGEC